MNSWEGRNANVASGTWGGNESDGWSGWGWGVGGLRECRKLSSRWWMRAVAEALGPSLCHWDGILWPPNFITMTQSHQHSPSDESVSTTGGLEQDLAEQVGVQWLVTDRDDCSLLIQPLELRQGIYFLPELLALRVTHPCWRLAGTAFCELNSCVTV